MNRDHWTSFVDYHIFILLSVILLIFSNFTIFMFRKLPKNTRTIERGK